MGSLALALLGDEVGLHLSWVLCLLCPQSCPIPSLVKHLSVTGSRGRGPLFLLGGAGPALGGRSHKCWAAQLQASACEHPCQAGSAESSLTPCGHPGWQQRRCVLLCAVSFHPMNQKAPVTGHVMPDSPAKERLENPRRTGRATVVPRKRPELRGLDTTL